MTDHRPGALGAFFTPPAWARWALDRLDAPALTAAGATVCDPTAGQGAFALALAEAWAGPRGAFDPAWARRITLVEREGAFLESFAQTWHRRWGFAFPEGNLVETDVVTSPPDQQFDLVVGNPPWVTYPDLGPGDQARYRPWFTALGLVGRAPDLLLGRSRLDLAALVTARAFDALVAPGGRAGFFLPLSLFHNDGAPGRWRARWPATAVFDLSEARPFPDVATRCGWAEFCPWTPVTTEAHGTVEYFTGAPGRWMSHRAVHDDAEAPLRLVEPGESDDLPSLAIDPWQRPRQGINTGGLNAAFHVAAPPPGVDPAYVHPLAAKADRFILVPYDRRGRAVDAGEVERSGLGRYWEPWKDRMASRKGVMLGTQLAQGRWWALLGVGPYTFAPYKVLWSAYGGQRLDARVYGPRDDGAVWQGDQALQAYVPCLDKADAVRIAEFLNGDEVGRYLAGLRGAGTRNWAQPGRFKRLWRFRTGPGIGERPTDR
jgi:hypothetical protein